MANDAIDPPSLNIPESVISVTVRVIDTGSRASVPAAAFLEPAIPGHEILEGSPAYPILVEHESGQKVIFDLGIRKDWQNFSPALLKLFEVAGVTIEGDNDVIDVLEEGGISKEKINAVIWSHWHFDHVGDTSRFAPSTELVVGPGFSAALTPGYPVNKDSPILETDYKDRPLRELDFTAKATVKLGRFDALDYFGDGSFYLLNAPGHTVGHICALARTTPKTFVFMGGDACHHCGEFRPTQYLPIPAELSPSPLTNPPFVPETFCPGSLFQSIHPLKSASQPFYKPKNDPSLLQNYAETEITIEKLIEFDANNDVLTIIAHDRSLLDVLDFFPASVNDWKANGWRTTGMWRFLADFRPALDYVSAEDNES
ncbi:beta-lactamase-like protein [Boeremia exigua]|uniref:beta-lactamase-like protein n=1 Tax=Boeremia exigua TaxID=749465 RepID=UPI001E8E7F6E|nr:beta-lactamase-like protein [Boeremia exigua]KAH6611799.1 beta-lactamase-like protein [Boeremia exigua]